MKPQMGRADLKKKGSGIWGVISRMREHAKNDFVRNVAMVASGTAGIQIINAMFSPLLTRQFGAEAFGALGAFMSLSAVLTNVAGLTYPMAIVLPVETPKARALAMLSIMLAVILGMILAAGIFLAGGRYIGAGLPSVSGVIFLLPLTVLMVTGVSVLSQWLIRIGKFSVIATAGVIQALVANFFRVAVGLVSPSATALVVIGALAPGLYILLLARGAKGISGKEIGPYRNYFSLSNLSHVFEVAKEYRDFPLYRAPQHLLNSLGMALPTLMLFGAFGATAAGHYAITQTVMGLPSILIGKSVGDVFYPKVTESFRENPSAASRQIIKATSILLLIGAIPFAAIVLVGPILFGFFFGAGWEQAGVYARWLAPFYLLNLANKPSVVAMAPMGLQGKLLVYEVVATSAKCGAFFLGFTWLNNSIAAIAMFSAAGSVAYVGLITYVIARAKRERV